MTYITKQQSQSRTPGEVEANVQLIKLKHSMYIQRSSTMIEFLDQKVYQ